MARQSRDPAILLTRPAEQSARFAAQLLAAHPGLRIVISPLLVPRFLSPSMPLSHCTALILASDTGAEAARRIAAEGRVLPRLAYCVGARTAAAARQAGFEAVSADGDAAALTDLIRRAAPQPPLLFLHGRETSGAIAETLTLAGLETLSVVVYEQNTKSLSDEATALLQSDGPVIAPVFSPRSARVLADELARIKARAPLTVVAISPAAAQVFGGATPVIAPRPDAQAMLEVIASRLASLNPPPLRH